VKKMENKSISTGQAMKIGAKEEND